MSKIEETDEIEAWKPERGLPEKRAAKKQMKTHRWILALLFSNPAADIIEKEFNTPIYKLLHRIFLRPTVESKHKNKNIECCFSMFLSDHLCTIDFIPVLVGIIKQHPVGLLLSNHYYKDQ